MVEHTTLSDKPKPLHVGPRVNGHTARGPCAEEIGTWPQFTVRPLNRIGVGGKKWDLILYNDAEGNLLGDVVLTLLRFLKGERGK